MTAGVVVRTRLGRLRGREEDGVRSFLGLRYAEPPRRFRPAVPSGPWSGTFDATAHRARAMQGPDPLPLFGPPRGRCAEDCLFLNVHVPAAPAARPRPVVFWVHGGALVNGSANDHDGSALARAADAVVVCPNYRLGLFGSADLRSCGPEYAMTPSLWLLDLVMALQWVRDHIEDLGGDPSRVLAIGQSVGATAALALAAMGAAGQLVTGVVASSPTLASTEPTSAAETLADARGTSRDEALAHLLEAPARDLVRLPVGMPYLLSGPVVDGVVLTTQVADLVRQARAPVPVVTGFARHEGMAMTEVLRPLVPEPFVAWFTTMVAGPAVGGRARVPAYLDRLREVAPWSDTYQMAERVGTDMCRRASTEAALAAGEAGGTAWHYRMSVPCRFRGLDLDSPHGCDAPFTFDWFGARARAAARGDAAGPPGALEVSHPRAAELASRWCAMIHRFCRTGEPGDALLRPGDGRDGRWGAPGGGEWPPYEPGGRATLLVSPDGCRVAHDLDPAFRTRVWPA